MPGLKIVFDPDFDSGAWPGPLHGRDAVAGETLVGPLGLLSLMETQLGLPGSRVSETERAAALIPILRDNHGFWSESLEVDPLGTARRLLSDADSLRMGGWQDEALTPRLNPLQHVTSQASPGVPHRLRAALDVLSRRPFDDGDIESITTYEPTEALPSLWRQVFAALVTAGATLHVCDAVGAEAEGDLGSACAQNLQPKGDGSLLLLRPHGPLAAADELAAWLTAREGRSESVVVIGADEVLDQALHRHGFGTLGAPGADRYASMLQILPLAVELGWSPCDPARALELLTLPTSPIPGKVRYRLIRALHQWPSTQSDAWVEALQRGLDAIDDAGQRKRAEARVTALFAPQIPRTDDYPADLLHSRVRLVADWARGRRVMGSSGDESGWYRVEAQCAAVNTLLDRSG